MLLYVTATLYTDAVMTCVLARRLKGVSANNALHGRTLAVKQARFASFILGTVNEETAVNKLITKGRHCTHQQL